MWASELTWGFANVHGLGTKRQGVEKTGEVPLTSQVFPTPVGSNPHLTSVSGSGTAQVFGSVLEPKEGARH